MAMSNKLIFQFSNKKTDGDKTMSDLLGSKGANLAEMSKIGINVPPGFTITTEVCNYFIENKEMPKNFDKGLGIEKVLKMTGYNKEEVLAMGDSYNDLPVFKKVGLSVAVANAHIELKKEADYVCEFENGEGVKEIIDKFF